MTKKNNIFDSNEPTKIWSKYCGFLDLTMNEFMNIQENLLLEEIKLVINSPISQKLIKGKTPTTMNEFRQQVPLTSYDDYAPFIGDKKENNLSQMPDYWARTSGKGGTPKWIPYAKKSIDLAGELGVASLILASASEKGQVNIDNGVRVIQNLAPRPYFTGFVAAAMLEEMNIYSIPPFLEFEDKPFEERVRYGFNLALRNGVDIIGSMSSIIIKIGEQFTDSSRSMKLSRTMLNPKIMFRLLGALYKSKKEKRSILPKDLWPTKGMVCYGMDTSLYRDKIRLYWGTNPLEMYAATEGSIMSIQAWNKKGLTFIPYSDFFEFIPEEEWLKNHEDKTYQPSTVLLNEVEEGKNYEVVVTNFYGMPFLRYRMGDMIKFISLEDREAGIRLPQMIFQRRSNDIIDIAGFTRLDEQTIWKAINNTGVKYNGWTARKEVDGEHPVLHVYIEAKNFADSTELADTFHEQLRSIDEDYNNMHLMLGIEPVKITLLPQGSFESYYRSMQKKGADLAHLKPQQMNASDSAIQQLLHPDQSNQE